MFRIGLAAAFPGDGDLPYWTWTEYCVFHDSRRINMNLPRIFHTRPNLEQVTLWKNTRTFPGLDRRRFPNAGPIGTPLTPPKEEITPHNNPTPEVPGDSHGAFDTACTKEQEDGFAARWDTSKAPAATATSTSPPPPQPKSPTPEMVPETQIYTSDPISTAEPEDDTVMNEAGSSPDLFTPLTPPINPQHTSPGNLTAPSTED